MALVSNEKDNESLASEDSGEPAEDKHDRLDDENFGCGRMKSVPQPKHVKPGETLTMRRRGQIDRIRENVIKPQRSLPPLHLPAWPYMPLDQKLPVVRCVKGSLFYARGVVGQQLYQTPKSYSNYDPNNQERVISEPYNALHDPHAKAYLQKEHIQKFLLKQGLITKSGQVLCSVKDFNRYRTYLNTLYTEDIHKAIDDFNGCRDGNRKTDATLTQYINLAEGKQFKRIQNMTKKKRQLELANLERIAMKEKIDLERQLRLHMERERDRRNRRMKAIALDRMRKEKLVNSRAGEQLMKERTLKNIMAKEQITKERIAYDKELVEQAYRQFVIEWMDSKWQTQEQNMHKNEILENSLEDKLKQKAQKRQQHVENYRAALPQILERQKVKKERLMNIVRKYFYRWLNNVRKRKARKPDAQHQSLWETSMVMDQTLKYLYLKSGYEKLDDFILTILKLKRDIKAELEAEEAAAAATGMEEDEDETIYSEALEQNEIPFDEAAEDETELQENPL